MTTKTKPTKATAKKPPPTKKAKPRATTPTTTPAPAEPPKLWFKVIVDGQSCHGGDTRWSLPKDGGTPGDWHAIPADEQLKICHVGFHLTDQPVRWYAPDCTIYIAEFDGEATKYHESDAKIAVRKVRL